MTVAGEAIGRVTGLYETGGVDVLVVTTEDGARSSCRSRRTSRWTWRGGAIVVDPPEGLLD